MEYRAQLLQGLLKEKNKCIFLLLDCFLSHSKANTSIVNLRNLYSSSFTAFLAQYCIDMKLKPGKELIQNSEPIKRQQFLSILSFMDSKLLDRQGPQRLNQAYRFYNFASVLLALVLQKPIQLLTSQEQSQLPEDVTLQDALKLARSIPSRYKGILGTKQNRAIIRSYNTNIDLLSFFQRILVNQGYQNLTWSQIYHQVLPNRQNDPQTQQFVSTISEYLWSNKSQSQRIKLQNDRIVTITTNISNINVIEDVDKQLFVILQMGQRILNFDGYSIHKELRSLRSENKSKQIYFKLFGIINQMQPRSKNNCHDDKTKTLSNLLDKYYKNNFEQIIYVGMTAIRINDSLITSLNSFIRSLR